MGLQFDEENKIGKNSLKISQKLKIKYIYRFLQTKFTENSLPFELEIPIRISKEFVNC